MVREKMQAVGVGEEDAENRRKWRLLIWFDDTKLGGAERRRTYVVIMKALFNLWFFLLLAGSHCVPVCEIISVQETEDDCPSTDVGKWQKVPQNPTGSNQHSFTGMQACITNGIKAGSYC